MPDVYSIGSDTSGGSGGRSDGSLIGPPVPDYTQPFYMMLPSGYEISESSELEEISVSVMALDPITASDASGLKAIILDLLGDYSAIQVEWAYENNNGYTSYTREIQPDYPWLCSAAIFAIVLYCLIRMGVAMLCKR